jgi:hypothetical protein
VDEAASGELSDRIVEAAGSTISPAPEIKTGPIDEEEAAALASRARDSVLACAHRFELKPALVDRLEAVVLVDKSGAIRDVDFDGKPGTLRFRRCATAALRKLRLRGARADKQKVRLVFGASLPSPEDP